MLYEVITRLPADVESRLDALAKKTGRTKTFYVREALGEYLADLEDYYLADRITSYNVCYTKLLRLKG